MAIEIDINNINFYQYGNPVLAERTKARLIEIKELGLTEVGVAEFGIDGVMSGLYIEKVWRYDDADWSDYINWVKKIKSEKQTK